MQLHTDRTVFGQRSTLLLESLKRSPLAPCPPWCAGALLVFFAFCVAGKFSLVNSLVPDCHKLFCCFVAQYFICLLSSAF